MVIEFPREAMNEQIQALRECPECGEIYGPVEGCACVRLALKRRARMQQRAAMLFAVASFCMALKYVVAGLGGLDGPTLIRSLLIGSFAALASVPRKRL